VYACDYLLLRYKAAAAERGAFGSVQSQTYYAVRQKDGKVEFMYNDPQNERCVNSLFPHLGNRPCWYAKRHTLRRVNM
jgi:hypothetical protein